MQNDSIAEQSAASDNTISVSMGEANRRAIPLVFLSIMLIVLAHWTIWGRVSILHGFHVFSNLLFFIPMVVLGSMLHEVLHAVGWVWFGLTPITTIRFGFQLEAFTMYAQCCVPLESRAYRAGLALPGVVLGVLPVLVGMVSGIAWVTMCGALFVAVATGDALVLWMIRSVPQGVCVIDHPTQVGCQIVDEMKSHVPDHVIVPARQTTFECLHLPQTMSQS